MKKSEPANPRGHTNRRVACVQTSAIAAEASGYTDIGMKKDALRIARAILQKKRITPEEFFQAVRTVGVHSSFNRWKTKIRVAYDRQSRRFKRKARSEMLSMYVSLGEWQTALQFVEIRRPSYADILFGMDVLLELNKLEEAELLVRRCTRALRCATDRFERSVLLTALGEFCSRVQRWDDAIAVWERTPLEQPFRRDALSGIAKIHLARALQSVDRGLQRLSELKADPDTENELCLPGNDLALTLQAEKELLKFKRGVEKLLPAEARKELGIKVG
jgi:hypothetical protein